MSCNKPCHFLFGIRLPKQNQSPEALRLDFQRQSIVNIWKCSHHIYKSSVSFTSGLCIKATWMAWLGSARDKLNQHMALSKGAANAAGYLSLLPQKGKCQCTLQRARILLLQISSNLYLRFI